MLEMRLTKWVAINTAGILPAYQGHGGNVLLYTEIFNTIRERKFEHAALYQVAETTSQGQNPSAAEAEWRPLDFIIPSETLWRQENDCYTTIAKPSQDTIAWSDEIVDGDFILSAQVSSEQPDGRAHFIVYGDGVGFSDGCLIFTYQNGYIFIEKDTLYGTDENFLVTMEGDFGFQEPTHDFTIEIKEGAANFYVDGKKVAFTFLPPETKSLGRIGFFADWQETVGMTYSDIKIKSLGSGDG
jgi:hypothetical protein